MRGGSADVFHALVDHGIRQAGGPGALGQLVLRCAPPPDAQMLTAALARLGADAWILGARCRWTWRGVRWQVRGPATIPIETGDDLDHLSQIHLHRALPAGCALRIGHAPGGLALTWDHRLLDARAAMGILEALPALAAGARLTDTWWADGYREHPELPPTAAARGKLARGLLPLIRAARLATLWRPTHGPAAGPAAGPLLIHDLRLDAAETAALDARIRTAAGRFGETAFLLAALAAALEQVGGQRGDLLFPLAVDARTPGSTRRLANCHGFSLLLLPRGLATTDLTAATGALKAAQRAWLAADGIRAMTSSLTFFPLLGRRMARAQLGNFKPGLSASCLIANTAMARLPTQWFGTTLLGIDHRVSLPHAPGLAVIFSRDARGAGATIIATEAVAADIAPATLAHALRHQLLERLLIPPGAGQDPSRPA